MTRQFRPHISRFALSRRTLALAGLLFTTSFSGRFAAQALAQLSTITPEIIQQSAPTPASDKVIADWIAKSLQGLTSKDADAIAKARREALLPLANDKASVSFRISVGKALKPTLAAMLKSDVEMQKINALVVAGDLGTSEAVELVASARADKLASVRYQSAYAARRIIEVSRKSVVVTADVLGGMLKACADTVKAEADPLVIDANLAAISAALESSEQAVRDAGLKSLSAAIDGLVRAYANKPLPIELIDGIIRTNADVRIMWAKIQVTAGEATKISGEIAGSVLAQSLKMLQSKAVAASDTRTLDAYDRLIQSTGQVIAVANPTSAGLLVNAFAGASLGKGEAKDVAGVIEKLNKALGDLTAAPFMVSPARLKL